jgi:glycosyltransferase involved in cell wall biosynthesis
MRILHIIGTLNPESGGPATAVANLIEFSPAGWYSEVVTLDDPNSAWLQNREFNITALGPTANRYGYNKHLLVWLKENGDRFDGIVVHGLWQFCGYATRKAFAGTRPYMVFVHGMLDPYFKHAFPRKHLKKWFYWHFIEYWVLRGARRVLFTGEAEEKLARQTFSLHQWNSFVFPLGGSLPEGDEAQRRLAFLNRFPKLQGRRYLLFLGRIDRKKGCDLLIEAFISTAAIDPGLDLVMAGPDEHDWRSELAPALARANLSSRVHWTGMLTGDEKWGAFLGSDAFILPSHQENFGIAVVEAMACGKPVLLSDKINIAADIASAGAGLIDLDTLPGTQRLIQGWIAMSPSQRSHMSHKALECFHLHYNMQTSTRAIAYLFGQSERPQFVGGTPSTSSAK